MCGIAGIIRSDLNFKVNEQTITDMLIDLERRGHDATGICWKNKANNYYVLKSPATASDFVDLPEYKKNIDEICKSTVILLHTRAASQGNPANNDNNHPLYNKEGIIIHNGIITVPAALPSLGATDSEQIMLYVQKHGWKEGLEKVDGWMAISYIDLASGDIFLYRELAPMSYFKYHSGALVFASTYSTLYEGFGVRPKKVDWLQPNIVYKVVDSRRLEPVTNIKRSPKNDKIIYSFGQGTATARTYYPSYDWC